jgi:hypothetical protein
MSFAPISSASSRRATAPGVPVAYSGSGGASAVRADRRTTGSGDVRRKAEFGSVMPILSICVRWGRAIGWVCKPEVTGSIPVRSITDRSPSRVAAHDDFGRIVVAIRPTATSDDCALCDLFATPTAAS